MTGPLLLDTLSRGMRSALGMGSAVIYPPSPGLTPHSREWAVKGRNARRFCGGMAGRCPSRVHRTAALRRLALYGRPRLCHSRRRDGGISSRAAPFPWIGKGRGIGLTLPIYKEKKRRFGL